MDMGTNGFYGDTFDNGFGVFETTKRRIVPSGHLEEPFAQRLRFANFSISYSPLNSDTIDRGAIWWQLLGGSQKFFLTKRL